MIIEFTVFGEKINTIIIKFYPTQMTNIKADKDVGDLVDKDVEINR